MTSHCAGTEQEEKRIRNWDKKKRKSWDMRQERKVERWSSGDVRWKTVRRRVDAIGNALWSKSAADCNAGPPVRFAERGTYNVVSCQSS